jgi:hypothetical protein
MLVKLTPEQHLLLFPAITKGFLPYIHAIFMEIAANGK